MECARIFEEKCQKDGEKVPGQTEKGEVPTKTGEGKYLDRRRRAKGEGLRDWLSIFKREKKEEIDKLIWRLVKEKVRLYEKPHFFVLCAMHV